MRKLEIILCQQRFWKNLFHLSHHTKEEMFLSENRLAYFFPEPVANAFIKLDAILVSDRHKQTFAYHEIKNQKPRCSFLAKRKTRIKCLHHSVNFRVGVRIVGYWHKQQPIFAFSSRSAVIQSKRNNVTHDIELKLGWVSSWFLVNSSNRRKRQKVEESKPD